MTTPDHRRQQLLDDIMGRAVTDTAFRTRLLTEPRDAIYDAFGVHVPPSYRIRFIEKGRDTDALIVLPDPKTSGGELSDDDLDAVAGGIDGNPPNTYW